MIFAFCNMEARIAELSCCIIYVSLSKNSCLHYAKGYHWCSGRFKHAPRPNQGLLRKSATDGGFSAIETTDVDGTTEAHGVGEQSADED